MKRDDKYLPEGKGQPGAPASAAALRQAMQDGSILEAVARSCTAGHDLTVPLGEYEGIIPREECALGIREGATREIAILSRVGKPVCFRVTALQENTTPPRAILSRRAVQQDAQDWFLSHLRRGDIIPARVTHIEPFGAFVDIGCGVTALIGIENLSVSRIFHPSERLYVGQDIYAAVLDIDCRLRRVTLTHRELLGTWEQNAALFTPGETVQGIVRSIESYGIFIELTPNLSGLAERREGVHEGQAVSVYIKSILPERMKIKLAIIDTLEDAPHPPASPRYFISSGRLEAWVYTPERCNTKFIMTDFSG